MTTEEAIDWADKVVHMHKVTHRDRPWPGEVVAMRELLAELARVTRERDRLIEAWPEDEIRTVSQTSKGNWLVGDNYRPNKPIPLYDTREEAVRAAAGLDSSP